MTNQPLPPRSSQGSCDRALFVAIKKQAMRIHLIMIIVIVVIAVLAIGQAPLWIVVLWASLAVLMQGLRSHINYRLPTQFERSTIDRLHIATRLSLLNGMVFASSAFFFNNQEDTSRGIYSLIMIGLVAETMATTHGYRYIFIEFWLPIFGLLVSVLAPTAGKSFISLETGLIIFLITVLGIVIYISSRDVYASLVGSCQLSEQLEVALVDEKRAHATKTRFLASASHDLRQPLHALSLLSAALTLRDLDERSATIAQRMSQTMTDLSAELDSLLDISKLDASVVPVKLRIFDINASVKRLLSNYEQAAENKGITLIHDSSIQTQWITDKQLFERLLRNLLDNAVKYTQSGYISVSVKKADGMCKITLRDTGMGIPDEEQCNVWDEFYQLKTPQRDWQNGLGLGLSIVSRLNHLLGGTIHMESVSGKGTQFTVLLPDNTAELLDNTTPEQVQQPLPLMCVDNLQGTRILVVDDDQSVRIGTRLLLETCGLIVYEAADTRDAMAVHVNHQTQIALCNLRLTNGDNGFKTVELLRQKSPELPIIIISGETSPEQLLRVDASGLEIVTKPVDAQQLLTKIAQQLQPEQPEWDECYDIAP